MRLTRFVFPDKPMSRQVVTFVLLFALAKPALVCGQIPTEIGKNHATVRAAFAPIVARANRSIARVFSGTKQEDVALATIVSANGHLLTKASELHDSVECLLPDGRRLTAQRIARDRNNDLALLKVDAADLPPMQWTQGEFARQGTLVAVTGRGALPLAIGVIAGAPRSVPPTEGVLGVVVRQTDLGPKITQVMPGSVAEKSGLAADDVVTHVGRRRVATCRDLVGMVNQFDPGQRFSLTVLRGGVGRTINTGLDRQAGITPGAGLDRDIPSATRVPLSNRRGGFPLVLQHDAVLRPNDCGGPLLDVEGHAVGLNIARADRATSYAIPAKTIQEILSRWMVE